MRAFFPWFQESLEPMLCSAHTCVTDWMKRGCKDFAADQGLQLATAGKRRKPIAKGSFHITVHFRFAILEPPAVYAAISPIHN